MILDNTMAELIRKYGISEVIASLCRECNKRSAANSRYIFLFRKLNRIYEWWVLK